ncbi:carbohydrate kinase family protein [Microbacterium resistens]|nr:PfkB family carbohydrate kinase [Microbacterium resistens]
MRSVFVAGPVSWNTLVLLDRLPEPVPHMQFAEADWQSLGGTSAGKALSLRALGRDVHLHTVVGADEAGARIRAALSHAGITVRGGASGASERHLNLMTAAGERVSLYLSAAAALDGPVDPDVVAAMARSAAIVIDLSAEGLRLLPTAREVSADSGVPIWVDLHDYDGEAAFHRPFLEAADAVLCSRDRLPDPVLFLRRCIAGGARLAVCTRGADGAIAVDADGGIHEVRAAPADVVDTNGAGDAFFAGLLDAVLDERDLDAALRAAAAAAVPVLGSRHLHPLLDDLVLRP